MAFNEDGKSFSVSIMLLIIYGLMVVPFVYFRLEVNVGRRKN